MPARRLASRPLAFSLAVLAAVLALTTACANSTTRARTASGTATPSPTATSTLPTSSQVTAYVGAGDHVYALDGRTGAVKWTYVTGHGVGAGGITNTTLMAGVVFFHGADVDADGRPVRALFAVDAATGALHWTLLPSAPAGSLNGLMIADPVAVVGNTVYLVAPGGQVPSGTYALDLASGKVLWGADGLGAEAVTVGDRGVYVAQAIGASSAQGPTDGTLTALDPATGAQRWQYHGLYGGMLLCGGLLCVTSGPPSTLAALDPATGATRWTRPIEDQTVSLNVIGTTLYVADQSGVSALDPATGQERWRYTTSGAMSWGTGIGGEGATLCLGYRDQSTAHIVGVDAVAGLQRWVHNVAAPSGGYGGGSGFGGGACYARTDQPNAGGSVLSRIDAATGTTTWTIDAGGQVVGQLSVFADAIYTETSVDRLRTTVIKALSVADGSTQWQFTPDVGFPGELAVG